MHLKFAVETPILKLCLHHCCRRHIQDEKDMRQKSLYVVQLVQLTDRTQREATWPVIEHPLGLVVGEHLHTFLVRATVRLTESPHREYPARHRQLTSDSAVRVPDERWSIAGIYVGCEKIRSSHGNPVSSPSVTSRTARWRQLTACNYQCRPTYSFA